MHSRAQKTGGEGVETRGLKQQRIDDALAAGGEMTCSIGTNILCDIIHNYSIELGCDCLDSEKLRQWHEQCFHAYAEAQLKSEDENSETSSQNLMSHRKIKRPMSTHETQVNKANPLEGSKIIPLPKLPKRLKDTPSSWQRLRRQQLKKNTDPPGNKLRNKLSAH